MIGKPVKSFQLNQISNSNKGNGYVSKKKFRFAILFIFLSLGAGFLVGNYTAINGFEIPYNSLFFQLDSTIEYDLQIVIHDEPLELGLNISSIYSTDPITNITYMIFGVTSWIVIDYPYELISKDTNLFELFDHDVYYYILCNENNTVYVKIENSLNVTLQKSLNFRFSSALI